VLPLAPQTEATLLHLYLEMAQYLMAWDYQVLLSLNTILLRPIFCPFLVLQMILTYEILTYRTKFWKWITLA